MKEKYYLFTFESTHGAIATDRLLKPIGCIVMPVPRAISTSCGISVRVEPEKLGKAVSLFREASDLSDDEFQVYEIEQDKAQGTLLYEPYSIHSRHF